MTSARSVSVVALTHRSKATLKTATAVSAVSLAVGSEERSLRQARPLGDLRDRRPVEPALGVELKGRLLQAAARVRLPPAHAVILGDDSDCHQCYCDDSN